MKPTDAERFEKLAEAHSTNADYCRHRAGKQATIPPKSIGCGHGSDCRRRPRQNRVRQSLPLSDSETSAGESFSELNAWLDSPAPADGIVTKSVRA
jgi:hypothetical protein